MVSFENGVGAPYGLWWIFGATRALDRWLADDAARRADYRFYAQQLQLLQVAEVMTWHTRRVFLTHSTTDSTRSSCRCSRCARGMMAWHIEISHRDLSPP